MPGLSQLKQFNKDIQSLGDELTLRASRGEKPVRVPIPKGVEDRNDSSDFELGMPEIAAPEESSAVDDDLSDITGISSSSSSKESDQSASFEAPDMSSLLNPVMPDAGMDMGMPDLSMFMDAPSSDIQSDSGIQEFVEEEPEEISVADMGLEALLSGAGFDGSEGTGEDNTSSSNDDDFDDFDDFDSDVPEEIDSLEDMDSADSVTAPIPPKPAAPVSRAAGDALDLDALFGTPEPTPAPAKTPVSTSGDALDIDALINGTASSNNDNPLDIDTSFSPDSSVQDPFESEDLEPLDSLNEIDSMEPVDSLDDIDSIDSIEPLDSLDFNSNSDSGADDFNSFEIPEPSANEDDESNAFINANMYSDLDYDDVNPFEEPEVVDSVSEESVDSDTDSDFDTPDFSATDFETPDFESSDSEDFDSSDLDTSNLDSSDFDSPGLDDMPDFGAGANLDFETDSSDAISSDLNIDFVSDTSDVNSSSSDSSESFDISGLDDFGSLEFGDTPDISDSSESNGPIIDDTPDSSLDDFGGSSFGSDADDFESDISDSDFDYNFESDSSDDNNFAVSEEEGPVEVFSTEGMEDFELEDTDSKLNGGGFDLDSSDGFGGGDDFEIPGFSDVSAVNDEPKSKKAKLDTPDFSGALEGKDLPPNTLSDAQYKKFLKNLNEYPLNVRLAFENFIVQDEFTDDAEFEIIEKILNKAPARQVAANLEKMLDISIPVPRDFEHRSASEYEAYKKSIAYQLKNRILPFMLMGIVLLLVGWGLFNFGKYCVVIPIQANTLYKQGYALLQADEYPQSEIKFDQAASKRMKKKWFFKYARGYREKKQYQRAGKMYKNILTYFKHDKTAGLEYADMALNDLADYESAEEIVRREILDYHANDSDAQLLLGDIFLEWGTEKDPEKLELAKTQYTNLLNETNNKNLVNLYNSRMMRYYIRTDNLAAVLFYKDMFEPKEKNLSAEDWTELSGYLLKKLYGPMAPSEENLRGKIEGLRKLLQRSVAMDPENPIALYNLGSYYVQNNENLHVEGTFKLAIEKFNKADHLKNRDIYKYIDSYRYLGENYVKTADVIQAQEAYSNGITLYTAEKEAADFKGNVDIGHLYADLADLNYFSSGDYDNAELNYQNGVDLGYDSPKIRYRLGYMQYIKNNYQAALGSFIKAGEGNVKEDNLLLAMGNTLSLRNDDYAAEGYYSQLIRRLNNEVEVRGGSIYPQSDKASNELVSTYLYAANNYGVTLHRLAIRTGDSSKNAQAIVQFQQSERAWDALTRNQKTMVRLGGSNLAEENIKYVTHPVSDFEPAIYIDIPKTLTDNESL